MRTLDILAAENGEHIRVLLYGEEQSYVVSCQHFRMPYPVASELLAELQPVPAEAYSVFVLDTIAHDSRNYFLQHLPCGLKSSQQSQYRVAYWH